MNKDRILLLATVIDNHGISKLGFNMSYPFDKVVREEDKSGHECKTVACIAGWTYALKHNIFDAKTIKSTRKCLDDEEIFAEAREFLDLSMQEANELFFVKSSRADMNTITSKKAAKHLYACVKKDRMLDWDETLGA